MKKALLYLFLFFLTSLAYGQCDELFISEYVEGTIYNKALEIYNPTETDIDLSAYRVVRWRNGASNSSPVNFAYLSGTVGARDVHVAVNEPNPDPNEGEVVNDTLLCLADGLYNPVYATGNAMYFNGNDCLTLEKEVGGEWLVVDIFATAVNIDPDDGWCDYPPYNECNFFDVWTADHAMIRKPEVVAGITQTDNNEDGVFDDIIHDPDYDLLYNPPSFFNPSVEWDTVGIDFFDNLGWHDCDCLPVPNPTLDPCIVSVKSYNTIPFQLFPNPLNGSNKLIIEAEVGIISVSLFNVLGQEASQSATNGTQMVEYNVPENLTPGIYLIKVLFNNDQASIQKLVIE